MKVIFSKHARNQMMERNISGDALYIRFNQNPYQKSEEVQEGIVFDYDKQGKIIGIEVLNASQKFPSKFKSQLLKRKLPLTFILQSRVTA